MIARLLVVALAVLSVARATPPDAAYSLVWADEFNGTAVDTSRWDYRTDSKHWSTQLPANLAVKDGCLYLNLKKEKAGGKEYTGAGVISKQLFKFGYYEARFKVPPTKGWHTSFWMQRHDGSGGTHPRLAVQELDVCENDSVNLTRYGTNTHRWLPDHAQINQKNVTTPDLSADFHVWGCEFTAEKITYFFDGKVVQTTDTAQVGTPGEMHIWLTSIASHLGSSDRVDDARLPVQAVFDYVRFYTKK